MTITKTAIGNYLRKQPDGDIGMYRNGFKDGVAWAQKRLAAPKMRKATRDEKIVNPGVYEVPVLPDNAMYPAKQERPQSRFP